MIQIAVLGYGTVGSGVVEVINTNHDSINKRAENEINIKYVLDLRDFPGDPVEKVLVHDYEVIANDPEVDIVVEVMGGVEPAYTFTKRALEAGKSVCTSTKELVARHGTELLAIAKEHGANYLFEASCGGGIPIIRPLNSSLTADEIDEVTGILNGTTNYILSKMASDGSDFADVLKEAQRLGYAERNPEADVEGYDACRKIAILSSLAYGKEVNYEEVYTEGITKITAEDIKYATSMGTAIKLLATSRKVGDQYYARNYKKSPAELVFLGKDTELKPGSESYYLKDGDDDNKHWIISVGKIVAPRNSKAIQKAKNVWKIKKLTYGQMDELNGEYENEQGSANEFHGGQTDVDSEGISYEKMEYQYLN